MCEIRGGEWPNAQSAITQEGMVRFGPFCHQSKGLLKTYKMASPPGRDSISLERDEVKTNLKTSLDRFLNENRSKSNNSSIILISYQLTTLNSKISRKYEILGDFKFSTLPCPHPYVFPLVWREMILSSLAILYRI
jgi:hypothetical protein